MVVAVTKAYHYWDGHLTADQQALAAETVWEPATGDEAAASPGEYEAAVGEMENGLRAAGGGDGAAAVCGLGWGSDGWRRGRGVAAASGTGRAGAGAAGGARALPSGWSESGDRARGAGLSGVWAGLGFVDGIGAAAECLETGGAGRLETRREPLPDIEPARSRCLGRRSGDWRTALGECRLLWTREPEAIRAPFLGGGAGGF